ncbi:MAG TPA: TonB-dependent receptor [Blastocatellia bacterium]|nr:TonB-dependent receptor [Blastocatellia bacterium]
MSHQVRDRNSVIRAVMAVLFTLLICPAILQAQTETGQIIGKVTDPAGALVTGATVTVKSVDTGAIRTATTNEQGQYTITNLQPGLYDVTVQASGFAPKTQRVQVTVGSQVSLDTTLTVQAESATIDVVASGGVEVNTQNQELSNVVSGNQIRELPSLTRNPYDFVSLSGNVSPADPSGRGVGFAINGQRAASTNILLDGGENVDTFTASVGQSVPLDSVQEFRVITSNFSAEYGRASGGIVNVATRAGSNNFHGSVYEFNRVSRFASNDFDNNANGIPKGRFTRNQFGYSVGGPVVRDRLFFFNSTEWIRVRSTENVINFVPTPQLLAASSAATRNFFNAFPLQTPINGPVITVADVISSVGATNFAPGNPFLTLPPTTPAFGQVSYRIPSDVGAGLPQNSYQIVTRLDLNISEKTQLYGRHALESQDFQIGTNSFSPYQGFNTGIEAFNNNILLSLTHAFSPRLVSQTKLVYNRLNNQQPLGAQPPSPTLYMRTIRTRLNNFLVALPGYLPFNPGSAIPFGGPQNLLQVYQDFNSTLGNHQFRFGGTYVHIQDNRTFGAYQTAVETLGANTAQALGNLVSGQLRAFQAAIDPRGAFPGQTVSLPLGPPNFSRSNLYNEFGIYVQDNWRFRPRLTLNLGLRYDYFGVQHNRREALDSNFYFGSGSTLQEQIRNGSVQLAQNSPAGGLWKPDKNNFGPRLGFAWDVTGNGKTSVRGGYGISYERNFGNVTFNVIQNPPNYAVINILPGVTPGFPAGSLTITPSNVGPFAGTTGSITLPQTSLRHVREDIDTAYAHFWSLSVERELLPGTIASLQYTGSAGRNLYSLENINRPGSGFVYLGDTNPLSRLNNQYSAINTRGKNGFSNYNGLIAEIVTSKFRTIGLSFSARYTFSKALDNLSSTFSESSNNFNLGLLDPFNPKLDYGPADFDVRHRFTTGFNWEVPFDKIGDRFFGGTGSAISRQIFGGWELTGIFTARSGSPFTVFDCSNAATSESTCPRVFQTGALPTGARDNPSPDATVPNRFNYLDLTGLVAPGSFVNPKTGNSDFGPYPANMIGRNRFRGPGLWNLDAGLYKRFKFTETMSLQLRAELYNVFNHANLFVIGDEADVSSGVIIPARRLGRRNLQLAAKFIF